MSKDLIVHLHRLMITALVFVLCFASGSSNAHPHAWIDVKVKVLLDHQGQIRGLHQTWLFDDFYSVFVLEGSAEPGSVKISQVALESLLVDNMANLAEYGYFTHIYSGENELPVAPPTNASTRVVNNRLEMSFELPLADSVNADDIPLRYSIYDPTYYIEMVHAKDDNAVSFEAPEPECSTVINQPAPDSQQMLVARSLDQSQKAPEGLGRFFAEVVTVTCN